MENILRCSIFCVDLHFWIESVCLSSVGTEFHIAWAAKKNERCTSVYVCILGIHIILLSVEERKFALDVAFDYIRQANRRQA